MPNTKNSNRKTSAGGSNSSKQTGTDKKSGKGHGMQPGAMPHIPTARERAKDMDDSRRGSAQTFEL